MDSIVYCNEYMEHAKNLLAFPLWEKGMQRAWMDEWLINFPRHFLDSKKCVSLLPCLHESDTAWVMVQITEYKFTLGTILLIDSSWTVTMLVIFLHHGTFIKQHISCVQHVHVLSVQHIHVLSVKTDCGKAYYGYVWAVFQENSMKCKTTKFCRSSILKVLLYFSFQNKQDSS